MDIKDYISSGILESYILGNLNDQETREVECMSSIYPELRSHLNELEVTIETWAMKHAVEAPVEVKQQVMARIAELKKYGNNGRAQETPVVKLEPVTSRWRAIAAACIVLAIGFGAMWLNNRTELSETQSAYTEAQNEIDDLRSANDGLLAENQDLSAKAEEEADRVDFISDPNTRAITLLGTPGNEEAKVRVFWNPEIEEASFVVDNLPQPSEELQYQLWAIVDGTPVDLGVFDLDTEQQLAAIKPVRKPVPRSQAFAITLEKKGGSPTPNLEALVVIGEV